MATITTTTNATPLNFPANTLIDRDPKTGELFALVKASTANTYEVWRYDGVTWTMYATLTRSSIVEVGSIFVTNVQWLHWCYRTNESGQDRVYWRRLNLTNATWSAEVLTGAPANGGTPGSVHTGLDLQVVVSQGQEFIAIAAGTTVGANHGVTLYGVRITTDGTPKYDNAAVFIGKRQWLHPGSGRITPSIDIEHRGDGKSSSAAHLWVTWGRTQVYLAKLTWSWRWTGPTEAQSISPVALSPAQDSIAARWDGQRLVVAVPDPTTTDRVMVLQRKRANTPDTRLQTPAHPAGVVRNCTVSYHHTTGNVRVFAVGTSTTVLYFVDYVRSTGTWGAWTQVLATAVMGTGGNQFSVRRGTFGNARHDVYTAHSGSPNTLTHTPQTVASPPDTPTWNTPGIGYNSGSAADVAAALPLDWLFSDPDPADVQSAYALSRQIGAGALQYWRASDSSWQATEQKNVSASTIVTLASGWAVATADPHTFAVKTWDSTDVASAYSAPLVLIPSGKVNPTITAPTPDGTTITTGQVTLTWTVAEQTAYKVRLVILGVELYNSGWITGSTTSFTVPYTLADGFSYSAFVQTRNNEGLPSNEVQRNFTVDVVPPAVASVVPTPVPAEGVIRVVITNPTPAGTQPAFVDQELWRRPLINPILNANTSFETDTSGWLAGVGGTAARDTGVGKFGTASLRLTPDGATAAPRLESDFIAVSPSTSYHADAWIQADTTNKGVALFFRWFTSSDVFISDSAPAYVVPVAADVFLYYGPIATSPANAAKAKLCAGLTATPAAGDRIWLDGVRVRATDGTDGVRVAKELPANTTVDDFQAVSGVSYEYRAIVFGANGAASHGPWQG